MLFSPKHILVPAAVDSEQDFVLAEHSVLVACDIAACFSSHISLLHLSSIPSPGAAALDPSGELYRSMENTLKNRLEKSADKLAKLKNVIEDQGIKVSARLVESLDDTADTILKAVGELSADLLVMSSHGRLGLSKLLFGSVASRVCERATIPVLILHPAKKA